MFVHRKQNMHIQAGKGCLSVIYCSSKSAYKCVKHTFVQHLSKSTSFTPPQIFRFYNLCDAGKLLVRNRDGSTLM